MEVPFSLCPILDARRLSRTSFASAAIHCQVHSNIRRFLFGNRHPGTVDRRATRLSVELPVFPLLRFYGLGHIHIYELRHCPSGVYYIYECTDPCNAHLHLQLPRATGSSPCPPSRFIGLGTEQHHNKCGPGPPPLNLISPSHSFTINPSATLEEFGWQI